MGATSSTYLYIYLFGDGTSCDGSGTAHTIKLHYEFYRGHTQAQSQQKART